MHQPNNNSVLASFGAGTVAGASGTLIGHPFDSLKVRLQVGRELVHQKYDLAWMKQLYRGVVPPILTTGAMASINFTIYEASRSWLNTKYFFAPTQNSHLCSVFIAGCTSGAFVSLISTPISVIKIQQQVATEKNLVNSIIDIYKKSGIRGFYRGFSTMLVLESPGRGVYMCSYETCKSLIAYANDTQGRAYSDRSVTTSQTSHRILSAALAGIFSWLVVYPFDVVKARVQLDFNRKLYSSTWSCAVTTWREGGVRAMYRGIVYTLVRAGPVAGTILPIYEATKDWIESHAV